MREDIAPDPETSMGADPDTNNSGHGSPRPEPELPAGANPVYNADLTDEEIVLLAALGIRNPTTGETAPVKMVAGVLARMMQKIREQAIEATSENKDSIELSRNAKEEYAWKIKVYMDAWKNPMAGIAIVENVNKELLTRYSRAPMVIGK